MHLCVSVFPSNCDPFPRSLQSIEAGLEEERLQRERQETQWVSEAEARAQVLRVKTELKAQERQAVQLESSCRAVERSLGQSSKKLQVRRVQVLSHSLPCLAVSWLRPDEAVQVERSAQDEPACNLRPSVDKRTDGVIVRVGKSLSVPLKDMQHELEQLTKELRQVNLQQFIKQTGTKVTVLPAEPAEDEGTNASRSIGTTSKHHRMDPCA